MKMTPNVEVFSGNFREFTVDQKHSLGAKASDGNGSTFRYVQVGATATVVGKLYDGPANVTTLANLTCAAAAIGVTSVVPTLGASAVTVNQYAGGQFVVNDEDGQGYSYTIKSHPASAGSEAITVVLEDDEPLVVALTATSQATLVANPYKGIVIHASTEAGVPVGVSRGIITAEYCGWIQTRGIVSVLHDVTPAEIGEAVSASRTTDGCVTEQVTPASEVGVSFVQGVSTEYNPVFLTMD